MSGSIITIGLFDGVHIGHTKIIGDIVAEARNAHAESVVVTFDRHPYQTVRPGSHPKLITTLEERVRLIEKLGVDRIVVLEFTDELADMGPQEFLDTVIAPLRCRKVVVGADFRFGRGRTGDIGTLAEYGAKHGFEVKAEPLRMVGNVKAGSSEIRRLLSDGDISAASRMLGRNPSYAGEVVHGDGRGTKIGFPTANLAIDPDLCLPRTGVYAGACEIDGDRYVAVVNIGHAPTFGAREEPLLEMHVLEFSGPLYGRTVTVGLYGRLRDEALFEDTSALVKQVEKDAQRAADMVRF